MARTVTFAGRQVELEGPELQVGDRAPEFTAVDASLAERHLADYAGEGRVVVLASVPSLDTSVCDRETRRFNEEAASLDPRVRVVVVSMDLPFAQRRWCGAAGVERVVTLSDHRQASFGQAYGVLLPQLRLLTRAVFVVGPDGRLTYARYLPDVAQEPAYDEVLAAARESL
jgi:thiol peroxidase